MLILSGLKNQKKIRVQKLYTRMLLKLFSVYPISYKQVCIVRSVVVAVRRPYQFFAIGRKHGESIKVTFGCNLFEAATIEVNQEKMKIVPFFRLVVARENNFFAVGGKKRCPVGFAQVGNLFQVAAIHIAGVNLHLCRHNQVLRQQVLVFFYILGRCWPRCPEYQHFAVGRKESAAIVSQLVGYLFHIRSVDVAGIQIEIAIAG